MPPPFRRAPFRLCIVFAVFVCTTLSCEVFRPQTTNWVQDDNKIVRSSVSTNPNTNAWYINVYVDRADNKKCPYEDVVFSESCCTHELMVYESKLTDTLPRTFSFEKPTCLTQMSLCLFENLAVTIVPNFTHFTTIVFEDDQYTTTHNEHCHARTGLTTFRVDTASEFAVVAKLAEEVTLNFISVQHQYVVVHAKRSKVLVTLAGTPTPGVLFAGITKETAFDSSVTNNVHHIWTRCGSSNYQRYEIVADEGATGEGCWCKPVMDGAVVKRWNSPDCPYQAQHLSLLIEESLELDVTSFPLWHHIVLKKPVMFTPTSDSRVIFTVANLEFDATATNVDTLPMINATGAVQLSVASVTTTLKSSCVDLAVFPSETAAKSFIATIPIGWTLLQIERLVRMCPASGQDEQIRCSITSTTWGAAVAAFPPQCPCKSSDGSTCLLLVKTPTLDWEQHGAEQTLRLENDVAISNANAFGVFRLNGFSLALASEQPVTVRGLFVAIEMTPKPTGNGEDSTVESPLVMQSDSAVIQPELKTDVSIDVTGVATLTVGEVVVEQSRDTRLPVFTTEAAETPLSLTVASVKRTVGDSSNVLLALQKGREVVNATACDGQALVANPSGTEQEV